MGFGIYFAGVFIAIALYLGLTRIADSMNNIAGAIKANKPEKDKDWGRIVSEDLIYLTIKGL